MASGGRKGTGKFLHVADLHLDSPLRTQALRNPAMGENLRAASRQVLGKLVDAAIAEDVDAVLLAGDTFDRGVADVVSRAALATELARLWRARIPAVLIQGNHDALLDLDRYGPVSDALHILTPDAPTVTIGDAAIHGVGFSAVHMPESLLPRYPSPEPGRVNVGLMHTSLGGAPGHDPYAPCGLSDLLSHGYEYWALGHIHKRAVYRDEGRMAVMPGIPQGRSVRETEGGSATLVTLDLDGPRICEIPLDILRFVRVPVNFAGATDQAGRDARLRVQARRAAETRIGLIAAAGAMRRLREERRGFMLDATQAAFVRMTGGEWERLETRPAGAHERLVGIRNGAAVGADAMSTGTRAQLYLALRVAGHADFVARNGPLPFIADDVLETFDDTRARATLALMAEMGRLGQAVMFTHHRHLVAMAQAEIPDLRVIELT
ncbi:DNA repair exonuclease [Citreimonas salinaria]|uniref:Calcineurin-like phosphoesterase n=1 Tax=Citreimonas salinaria TaxID=321339 RepID=A0A1H3IND9_9RHOB|nr:DNA repair exonuclease [Citreimonas salinaria]SDY28598.1 Calcineurin-like phosphoesterase [Citreimonas salinaria]